MHDEVRLPGLIAIEHTFEIPLDHGDDTGERITVFARELAHPDGRDRPFLVYFQGGPGFEAVRPTRRPNSPGWLERALEDFRVLMLDQRGTGRSSPIGTIPGRTAAQQAEYLAHFRADAIVRDAEWIRTALGVERWSVLGQSFGGFCVMTYLSLAPEALREAFITGGLAALGPRIDEVYTHTYARVLERTHRYYERYPGDRDRVRRVHELAANGELTLPSGDRLSSRRFRQLGHVLGMSDGAEQLHYMLELPPTSPGFLHDVADAVAFGRNPLYAVLHEASWADGGATRWSAERMLPADYESPELFTGEHVYPWMFEDYGELAPLRGAAHLLAEREWPRLYDPDALARNQVPVAAAIYTGDMYVARAFSEETAAQIRGARAWITSEYEHNGLRADGERILGRLIDLARE
jgi:pimeloyl-ACP methyl ester carboxylesterase